MDETPYLEYDTRYEQLQGLKKGAISVFLRTLALSFAFAITSEVNRVIFPLVGKFVEEYSLRWFRTRRLGDPVLGLRQSVGDLISLALSTAHGLLSVYATLQRSRVSAIWAIARVSVWFWGHALAFIVVYFVMRNVRFPCSVAGVDCADMRLEIEELTFSMMRAFGGPPQASHSSLGEDRVGRDQVGIRQRHGRARSRTPGRD